MQYLLDELMAYEEGFRDIMMGDRASERHEMFMGAQDLLASASRADLMVFENKIIEQIRGLLTSPGGLTACDNSSIPEQSKWLSKLFKTKCHITLQLLHVRTLLWPSNQWRLSPYDKILQPTLCLF